LNHSCIQRVNRLLRDGRRRLRSGRKALAGLRLVTGSPAADADCLASSIGYALLQSLDAPAGTSVLPWVPIPRAELALLPEVLLLARRAGLAVRCLACAEDFAPSGWKAAGRPELILVDSDGAWLPASAPADRGRCWIITWRARPAEAPGRGGPWKRWARPARS
jgi:hypothetical protein